MSKRLLSVTVETSSDRLGMDTNAPDTRDTGLQLRQHSLSLAAGQGQVRTTQGWHLKKAAQTAQLLFSPPQLIGFLPQESPQNPAHSLAHFTRREVSTCCGRTNIADQLLLPEPSPTPRHHTQTPSKLGSEGGGVTLHPLSGKKVGTR